MSYGRLDDPRVRRPRRKSAAESLAENGVKIVAIIAVVLLVVGGGFFLLSGFNKTSDVTFRVTDKQIMNSCNNGKCDHQYMIYTDHGVYKDTDSFFHWKFNSSDVFAKLEVGKTYTCKVYGIRNHFTSDYKNIVSCVSA